MPQVRSTPLRTVGRLGTVMASLAFAACGGPPRPTAAMSAPRQLVTSSEGTVLSARIADAGIDVATPEAFGDAGEFELEAGRGAERPGTAARLVDSSGRGACPSDMILVEGDYCAKPERTCLEEEYSPQNKIVICHRFSETQKCAVPIEQRRYCIDKFEYPNRAGGHPPWMVSWYDAQATCLAQQKRTCWESEWVAACEGPEHTPFPYGYSRDNGKCNIDNAWIQPSLKELYSREPDVAEKELSRLDQSVPSGEMDGCTSGYGVHDLTGNFDEWVTADRTQNDKSQWAGLKGGAWGHVRNACRPMTTSHPPDFTYYFIAFRCCRDTDGSEPYRPANPPEIPVVKPALLAVEPHPSEPPGPSAHKVGRETGPLTIPPGKR